MNIYRGHESQAHRDAKATIGRLFDDPAWSVFYEQRNADILVLHHASRFVAAIEVESSPRNVLNNINRNVAYGCHAVAVISLTKRYLSQITNKVLGHVEHHDQIKVFRYDEQDLHKLQHWIEKLAQSSSNQKESP